MVHMWSENWVNYTPDLRCTELVYKCTEENYVSMCLSCLPFFPPLFKRLKVCGNFIKQDYGCHFPNSICSLCASVSHFGNSCNISIFLHQ